MKDLIKEVALDIANKLDPERARLGGDFQFGFNTVQLFAELVVAELSKRAEAVGRFWHNGNGKWVQDTKARRIKGITQPLFTFPPIHDIEAIENRVAEACAKVCMGPNNDGNIFADDCAEAIRSGEWRKYK